MDLKAEILRDYSKAHVRLLAQEIGEDPLLFEELIALFLGPDWRIAQRASWVVSHCHDRNPSLILPYLDQIIGNLHHPLHVAVKRNTVRILQDVDVPDELLGPLADHCFEYLANPKETVAVKVFSMTILKNCVLRYPDFKDEVFMAIKDGLPNGTPGFLSRARKVLKAIDET